MIFSHQFRIWAIFFSAVCTQVFDVIIKTPSKNFSSVVKTAFYVSTGIIWEEKILRRNLFICFLNFGKLSELFTGFRQTFFESVVETAIYVSRNKRNTLTRKNISEKTRFFIFSPWSEIFQTLEWLSKVLFLFPEEQFEDEKLFRKHYLYSNLNWKVPWELLVGKFVFIEKTSFFIKLGYWSNIFRLLIVRFSTWLSKCHSNCSAVLSKLHSTLPYEQFGE